MAAFAVLGIIIVLAGVLGSVVYYIRRSAVQAADLRDASAAVVADDGRVAKLEDAATQQRDRRLGRINAQAAAVTDATSAAQLLKDVTAR